MQILQFIRKRFMMFVFVWVCLCAHMHTCMNFSMMCTKDKGAFRNRPLAAQTQNVLPVAL